MNSADSAPPFVISRTLAASRAQVWRAWTEKDQLAHWFGPKGVIIPTCTLDLRPGGTFHYCMRLPDGSEMWGRWKFREISPPARLVWINSFSDPQGGLTRAPFAENWPKEMLCILTLQEENGRTTIRLESSAHESTPEERKTFGDQHESMRQGWSGTFDQLEAHLSLAATDPSLASAVEICAGANEILLTRVFDAPRELVWDVWTEPAHVVHWWGPNGFTTRIETMEVRPGGVWKHVMVGPDGTEYPNKSIFTEVVKPERITYRHGGGSQGKPGANFTATWIFEAVGACTRLTLRMTFPTAADRDTVVKAYGAVEGGKQTLSRLHDHLARQPAR